MHHRAVEAPTVAPPCGGITDGGTTMRWTVHHRAVEAPTVAPSCCGTTDDDTTVRWNHRRWHHRAVVTPCGGSHRRQSPSSPRKNKTPPNIKDAAQHHRDEEQNNPVHRHHCTARGKGKKTPNTAPPRHHVMRRVKHGPTATGRPSSRTIGGANAVVDRTGRLYGRGAIGDITVPTREKKKKNDDGQI